MDDHTKGLNEIWNWILEMGIATEEELVLITNINGFNGESLNSVIYCRTAYHDMEQYIECEGELS